MKLFKNIALLVIISITLLNCKVIKENPPRIVEDFNFDWQFFKTKEELPISSLQTIKDWESVKIPHDWSITTPYNQAYKVTDSTPNLGFIGYYKKDFKPSSAFKGKSISISFDGVYNNSEVFLNGEKIGERPYGFSPFSIDLTGKLNFEATNTLLVKVNRKAFLDGRWYNGAGIYRDVKFIVTEPIHFKKWGIGITTPTVSTKNSTVHVEIDPIVNQHEKSLAVAISIFDKNNLKVAEKEITVAPNKKNSTEISIENPLLWSPDFPNLYHTIITLKDHSGKIWDIKKEVFGIRSLKYDANEGFFLNGEKTYFKGVCLHHDAGALGVAVPDDVWIRRLKTLKQAGVNAIRTAHNTPAESFLNMCDELGFLVQSEAFDEMDYPKDKRRNYNSKGVDPLTNGYTNHFQQWGEQDLKDMLLRDRNHPSIVMWSIGNEIEWTYPRYGRSSGYWNSDKKYYYDEPPISIAEMKENMKNNPPLEFELAKTAQKLSKWVKEIDTTRPVTANLVIPTVSHFSGYTDALDIVGYSYRAAVYKYGHKNYPEKMILGTENWANYVEWKSVLDNPHIPGIFLWTGIYYMGETGNVNERGSDSGLIDFAGFPTPRWHMFKTLWNSEPEIYMTTIPLKDSEYIKINGEAVDKTPNLWRERRWGFQPYNTHFNYAKNEEIVVEVYTNCDTAELFLNNTSLGIKKLASNEDHIIKWIIPYAEGTLKVVGNCNKEVIYELKTAQTPSKIELKADKVSLKANAYDVVHIEAQLIDVNGNPVKHTEKEITFKVEGPAILLGTDNGNNIQRKRFDTDTCITSNGKLLLMLQSTKEKGTVTVKATANGIESNPITITIN